jgi:DNA-binding transcriptional LysR family regulator
MDTLTSLEVFRQVVESGSFVSAAEKLEMSTAMVSKHMKHTEERLGVRLLNRNNRALSLTEPGRVYLERSKNVLDDLQATEVELGALGSVPRGTLRLSAPSSPSGRWLTDLLAQHRRQHPDVMLDISYEDRWVDLVAEGYDVALRFVANPDSLPAGLIARPIRSAAIYLAASREYLERRGTPQSLEDLAQHDFVAVGDLLNAATLRHPKLPKPRVVLRYRSMSGVGNAVAAGIGIAPVPEDLFEDPVLKHLLIRILPEHPIKKATLYVVYASRKFAPLKIRTFVDFMVANLSRVSQSTLHLSQARESVARPRPPALSAQRMQIQRAAAFRPSGLIGRQVAGNDVGA